MRIPAAELIKGVVISTVAQRNGEIYQCRFASLSTLWFSTALHSARNEGYSSGDFKRRSID